MFDAVRFGVSPCSVPSPQTLCRLLLYAAPLGTRFEVRKHADDIYNILPFREEDVHDAILGKLRPGDVFIDGGANVGYYTVLGARVVGPHGTVVAIEAAPSTAKQLSQNIKLNGLFNTVIVNKAIQGDPQAKFVELHFSHGNFGMASLTRENQNAHFRRLRVHAGTIDNICSAYVHIRLMKLDIEGAELDALKGAKNTLAKTDYVVVECNESKAEIHELLANEGFVLKNLKFTTYVIGSRKKNPAAA